MEAYVPYNFEIKKFGQEWSSGGCSGVSWEDSPTGCRYISCHDIIYFKENNPNQPLSKMVPSLRLACSQSAKEDIQKCGVVKVKINWEFA